jgi:hypothetical protein
VAKRPADDLTTFLTTLLQRHGFARSDAIAPRDQTWWVRAAEWREDCVWMGRDNESESMTLSICVHVVLSDRTRIVVDGGSVAHKARGGTSYHIAPEGTLFAKWRQAKLSQLIASDIAIALEWFRDYQSPESCLAKLDSHERNGCGVGSAAWDRARHRLLEFVGRHRQ